MYCFVFFLMLITFSFLLWDSPSESPFFCAYIAQFFVLMCIYYKFFIKNFLQLYFILRETAHFLKVFTLYSVISPNGAAKLIISYNKKTKDTHIFSECLPDFCMIQYPLLNFPSTSCLFCHSPKQHSRKQIRMRSGID